MFSLRALANFPPSQSLIEPQIADRDLRTILSLILLPFSADLVCIASKSRIIVLYHLIQDTSYVLI